MTTESTLKGSLIDEDARRRFEQAWRAGSPLTIEDVLPPVGDPRYLPTLEELVLIEMELGWKRRMQVGADSSRAGTLPGIDAYLDRFPLLNAVEVVRRMEAEEESLRERFCGTVRSAGLSPRVSGMSGVQNPVIPGYEILGELGRGGMGVVFQARQVRLNRIVALKMILGKGHVDRELLGRFQFEAQAIARLSHPNIVPIYEVGEQDGTHFFSMELLEGGTLAQRSAGTPLAAAEACPIVKTLANAIHVAHQHGIIHRDLKPANVMLAADGTLKVGDFGLAKDLAEDAGHTQTGLVLGTPSYMAPEQAAGWIQRIGPGTDVYALGAILYELLTGRPPFKAATLLDTLELVRNQDPVPPSRLQPKVPRDLETICLKCLEKDPARRYSSAQELADDLARFQAGQPILARPIGVGERVRKWLWRQPVLAALVGVSAVALLAIVGGLVSLFYSSRLEGALNLAEQEGSRARSEAAEADRQRSRASRQEALAQRYLYLAKMGLAQRAWDAGEGAQVLDLLEEFEHLPDGQTDHRSFEWHYLRALSRHLRTFRGHQDDVAEAVFSPDGRTLASCGDDGTFRLWEVATGRLQQTLPEGGKQANAVVFHPDGLRVAAASDRGVIVWNIPERKTVLRFEKHGKSVRSLCYSPDGKRLASAGSDGTVKVWDATTGEVRYTLPIKTETVTRLCYSHDGKQLAWAAREPFVRDKVAATAWLRVRDAASGEEVLSIKTDRAEGLAFSPDGKRLATGGAKGQVILWDAVQGKQVATLDGKGDAIRGVAFNPAGTRLAAVGENRVVHVWDVGTGKPLSTLRGHGTRARGFLNPALGVTVVAFSPDGNRLVTGGDDQTLRLWNLEDPPPLRLPPGLPEKARYRIYSPNRDRLASSEGDATVTLWDLTTGKVVRTLQSPGLKTRPMLFSPDQRFLAVGSSDLPFLQRITRFKVWDLQSGQEVLTLEGRDQVLDYAFSPEGRTLALGGHGVVLGDTSLGKKTHQLDGHDFTVYAIAFSPDGRRLASASEDATVKVWDVQTGQEQFTLRGHQWGVNAVAFSPDGLGLVTGGGDNAVRLWDVATGTSVHTLLGFTGHREGVDSVRFSSDGRRILSVGREGMGKVWDRETGLEILTVPMKDAPVLVAWRDALRLRANP